jgi:methanogenic corrinoid protein MtbC1
MNLPPNTGRERSPLPEHGGAAAFHQALLFLDAVEAGLVLRRGLDAGASPAWLAQACITPALERIGEDWDQGALALSQVYMAGRIAEEVVEDLFPLEAETPAGPAPAVALLEDFHTLGKRMVQVTLRAAGRPCADYGRVTVEELVTRILSQPPSLVLVSTLMLRSALRVKAVKDALRAVGCHVPIVVGGAPFRLDPGLWREVGADGFGRDAADAIQLVDRFGRRP